MNHDQFLENFLYIFLENVRNMFLKCKGKKWQLAEAAANTSRGISFSWPLFVFANDAIYTLSLCVVVCIGVCAIFLGKNNREKGKMILFKS